MRPQWTLLIRSAIIAVVLTAGSAEVSGASSQFSGFDEPGTPTNSTWRENYPDYQFAAAANLVQARWRGAPISTAQVVDAYEHSGLSVANWIGLNYLVTTGFGGHKAKGYHPIADTYSALHHALSVSQVACAEVGGYGIVIGGVQVSAPSLTDVAVVAATPSWVEYVYTGKVVRTTWKWWVNEMVAPYYKAPIESIEW
jgi:hypothetical protein